MSTLDSFQKLEKQIGSAAKDAERDEVVKKSIKGKNLGNTEESERSESEDENQHDNGKEKKNNILKMKIYSNANDDDDDILVLKKKHFHDEASDDDIKVFINSHQSSILALYFLVFPRYFLRMCSPSDS